MKGGTRQVLNVPITPDSTLARDIKKRLGNLKGPDHGCTKVVEKAGRRITSGIQKDDPFPNVSCMFDETCLAGASCSKVCCCYEISCDSCAPEPLRPRQPATTPTAGSRRSRYVGQTGTTLHRRQKSHVQKKDNIMDRHSREFHSQKPSPSHTMRQACLGGDLNSTI